MKFICKTEEKEKKRNKRKTIKTKNSAYSLAINFEQFVISSLCSQRRSQWRQ